MLEQAILVLHVLAAIFIVVFILLQQGKGAEAGASFGGGASQTVLGVEGGGNMLTRVTAILATIFFISSLSLGYFAKQKSAIGDDFIVETPAVEAVASEQNDEIPALDDNTTVIDASSEDIPQALEAALEEVANEPETESVPAIEAEVMNEDLPQ